MPRRKKRPRGRQQEEAEQPPVIDVEDDDDDVVVVKVVDASPKRQRKRRGRSSKADEERPSTPQPEEDGGANHSPVAEEGRARSPPRKKRRSRTPKKKVEASDDEEEYEPPKSGRGTAKKKKAHSETMEEDVEENDEEKEAMACPHCQKSFSTKNGLAYHLDKKVCQTESKQMSFPCPYCDKTFVHEKRLANHLSNKVCQPKQSIEEEAEDAPATPSSGKRQTRRQRKSAAVASAGSDNDEPYVDNGDDSGDSDFDLDDDVVAAKKGRGKSPRRHRSSGGRPSGKFHKLQPGEKFVTRFGVVEVVADDRLPTVHHKTAIDEKAGRTFARRCERHRQREMAVVDQFATGTRHRREELKKMQIESTQSSGKALMSQKKVWDLYCKSVTPKEILADGMTREHIHGDSKKKVQIETIDSRDDPRAPRDYYPDRIVECKLIQDEREVKVGTFHSGPASPGRKPFQLHTREKAVHPPQTAPMHLFIARRELWREYSTNTNYICGGCGLESSNIEYHMSNRICLTKLEEEGKRRRQRIEEVESKALSQGSDLQKGLLTSLHGVIKAPEVKAKSDGPAFGNPHRIKEFKKHKMPPWLVFNDQRSSMYPEIYLALEFRRGSQNRNHFRAIKKEDNYLSGRERTRLRKKLKNLRKMNPGMNPLSAVSSGGMPATANETEILLQAKAELPAKVVDNSLVVPDAATATAKKQKPKRTEKAKKKPAAKKARDPLASGLDTVPPLPPMEGDEDPLFESVPDQPLGEVGNEKKKKTAAASTSYNDSRRRKRPMVSKKKKCLVIDIQVLATECEQGRYPSIKRFEGDHEKQCGLCKKPGDEPPINCDFCKNTVHQTCLEKRMLNKDPQYVIREHEPHDTPMCHECIYVCLVRRARAENRRLMKWQNELSKAGLEHAPAAADLPEEVNLKSGKGNTGPSEAAKDDDEPTYAPCPDGGPGGLICCSYCTAAYSRFLSNTAKEMEAQSVARAGQEVSEIMELLADAKQRLQRAADVSQSNEERRGLLDQNQSAHHGDSLF